MWYIWSDPDFLEANAENSPALDHNRAFAYGDGVFERISVGAGRPLWVERHLMRLYQGADRIGLEMPVGADGLLLGLNNLATSTVGSPAGGATWRLFAFRVSGGRYQPHDDRGCLMLQTAPAPLPYPAWSPDRLHIGVAQQPKVAVTLPEIKRSSALDYVLAAREARRMGWHDALMLNPAGMVAECSSSNVFVVAQRQLLTPPLADGCLPGVMRGLLLESLAGEVGLSAGERSLTLADCLGADAVLLTNASSGIRDVGTIGSTSIAHSDWARHLQRVLQHAAHQAMGIQPFNHPPLA